MNKTACAKWTNLKNEVLSEKKKGTMAEGYIHYDAIYAKQYYIQFMGICVSKGIKIVMAMIYTNFGIVGASEERRKEKGQGGTYSIRYSTMSVILYFKNKT